MDHRIFYTHVVDPFEPCGFRTEKVEGCFLEENYAGFLFFGHYWDTWNYQWAICEFQTGTMVGWGLTAKEALINFRNLCKEKDVATFISQVELKINKFGILNRL